MVATEIVSFATGESRITEEPLMAHTNPDPYASWAGAHGGPGWATPPTHGGAATPSRSRLSWWLLTGALALAAATVIVISIYSSTTSNGVVVECSDENYGPYVFAPLAVLAGLVAAARARRAGRRVRQQLLLGLLCAGLGAGQLGAAVADVNLTVHEDRCENPGASDLGDQDRSSVPLSPLPPT
jgi:hypothetical protein